MASKGEMWVFVTGTASRGHTAKYVMAHMNSPTASRSHIKAYQRCNQPTSKVSITRKLQGNFQSRNFQGLNIDSEKIRVPDGSWVQISRIEIKESVDVDMLFLKSEISNSRLWTDLS